MLVASSTIFDAQTTVIKIERALRSNDAEPLPSYVHLHAREQWSTIQILTPIIVGVSLIFFFIVVALLWGYRDTISSPSTWRSERSYERQGPSSYMRGSWAWTRLFHRAKKVQSQRPNAVFNLNNQINASTPSFHGSGRGGTGHIRLQSSQLLQINTTGADEDSSSSLGSLRRFWRERASLWLPRMPWQARRVKVKPTNRRGGFEMDGVNSQTPIRTGPMGHFPVPRDEEAAIKQEDQDTESSFQSPDANLIGDEERESLIASVMLISNEQGREFSSNPTTSLGHSDPRNSLALPTHQQNGTSSNRASLSGPPQTAYPDDYYTLPQPAFIQNSASNGNPQAHVRRAPAHRRKSSNLANEYIPGVGVTGVKLQPPVYSHSRSGSASAPDLRFSPLQPNRRSLSPPPENQATPQPPQPSQLPQPTLPPLAPNRYIPSVPPPESIGVSPQNSYHTARTHQPAHQLHLETSAPPPPVPPSSWQPHSGAETSSPYSANTTTEGSMPSSIDPSILAMYPGRTFTNLSDMQRAQSLESSIVEPHYDEVRLRYWRHATNPPVASPPATTNYF